jgi:homoserine O-acetyltransferase
MSYALIVKLRNVLILLPSLATLAATVFLLLTVHLNAQDGKQQFARLGQCKLENGAVIENCNIGYRTFGALNAARDNAVLMPTWLYGTSADLEGLFGDPKNATQDSQAKILVDTSKYFGVAIQQRDATRYSLPCLLRARHGGSRVSRDD